MHSNNASRSHLFILEKVLRWTRRGKNQPKAAVIRYNTAPQTLLVMRGAFMKQVSALLFILIMASQSIAQQTEEMKRRGLTDSSFPRVHKLAENVYAYEMLRAPFQGARFTTNNLVVVTAEGILVADAQGSPEDTTRLIEEIKKLSDQPIKYVVIGSEHVDHTGGNASFPATVTFIAHPGAKRNLETQANNPNRGRNAPKIVIPNDVVIDKRSITLGGTEIQLLNLGRCHTGTDLTVFLPKQKVVFMSECYFHNLYPSLRTGF